MWSRAGTLVGVPPRLYDNAITCVGTRVDVEPGGDPCGRPSSDERSIRGRGTPTRVPTSTRLHPRPYARNDVSKGEHSDPDNNRYSAAKRASGEGRSSQNTRS